MNLLIVSDEKLKKEDFFSNIKTGEIKPKSLEKIKSNPSTTQNKYQENEQLSF